MALTSAVEIEEFIKNTYEKKNPFVQTCGIKVESVKCGESVLGLEVDDPHTNIYGCAHGGIIATMIDTSIGVLGASCGKRLVTLSMNVNYINSIYFCDKATATGKIVHKGQSTMLAEIVVTNSKGELIAKGSGTLFVVGDFEEIPAQW